MISFQFFFEMLEFPIELQTIENRIDTVQDTIVIKILCNKPYRKLLWSSKQYKNSKQIQINETIKIQVPSTLKVNVNLYRLAPIEGEKLFAKFDFDLEKIQLNTAITLNYQNDISMKFKILQPTYKFEQNEKIEFSKSPEKLIITTVSQQKLNLSISHRSNTYEYADISSIMQNSLFNSSFFQNKYDTFIFNSVVLDVSSTFCIWNDLNLLFSTCTNESVILSIYSTSESSFDLIYAATVDIIANKTVVPLNIKMDQEKGIVIAPLSITFDILSPYEKIGELYDQKYMKYTQNKITTDKPVLIKQNQIKAYLYTVGNGIIDVSATCIKNTGSISDTLFFNQRVQWGSFETNNLPLFPCSVLSIDLSRLSNSASYLVFAISMQTGSLKDTFGSRLKIVDGNDSFSFSIPNSDCSGCLVAYLEKGDKGWELNTLNHVCDSKTAPKIAKDAAAFFFPTDNKAFIIE